jgi:hypothetical protein
MKSWRRLEWASAWDQQETHHCVQHRDGTDSCFSNDVKSLSLDEEMVVWIFSSYPPRDERRVESKSQVVHALSCSVFFV